MKQGGRSMENVDLYSLNYRKLGKVKIDCQIRQSKNLWGVYGEDKRPAGIIYIDLKFDQPKDYIDDDKTRSKNNDGLDLVHMVDRYGPKYFNGEPKTMAVLKTINGTPSINVMGNGFGGAGVNTSKVRTYSSRWSFQGMLEPGTSSREKRLKGGRTGVYRSIKWELSENDIEAQSFHSNIFHTGFTFQHDRKLCYMRVEIEGKLQRTRDRFKQKLKFPPQHRKDQGLALTSIDLSRSREYTKRLDAVADGLDQAMRDENYTEIPSTIPDTLPPFYPHGQKHNFNTSSTQLRRPKSSAQSNFIQGTSPFHQTQTQTYLNALGTTSDPLIEGLSRALDPIYAPDSQCRIHDHEYPPSTVSSDQTTLVDESPLLPKDAIDVSSKEVDKKDLELDEEAVRRLPQNSALWTFMQVLWNLLMGLLGRGSGDGREEEGRKKGTKNEAL
ncbi:2-amino-3-carboxymuconate-6-semialdehyde decarboxylase protein [Rutstroemia sp. NJR-2017a WRK4]|nr:2-amino-3-carboxymuconate-6-semialdehyde decarboxylase protein [Rutstroemia sp. NJR-2017a WRK4]